MRRTRFILSTLLICTFIIALYLVLRSNGLFDKPVLARVQDVPKGDQEIVWIHASTSGASWERFVAGIRRLQQERPDLEVGEGNTFLDQTTAVPEVVLKLKGCDQKLWIRWYKLTSDTGVDKWVEALAERDPPPLAIIGGGSSDRARDLARALKNQAQWRGQSPLLLITTATADVVRLEEKQDPFITSGRLAQAYKGWPNLMSIYPDRSFRFCFTNSQMAEAVVDFVWSQPHLCPPDSLGTLVGGLAYGASGDAWGTLARLAAVPELHQPPFFLRPRGSPSVPAGAVAQGASGDYWSTLMRLVLVPEQQQPPLFALQWVDDPYSIDLAEQFSQVFNTPERQPNLTTIQSLSYSVGGYSSPNLEEADTAKWLVNDILRLPDQRPLLVLPTAANPARRLLRTMTASAPLAMRNLVVVTGDAINFNTIYRDRDTAWNIQDIPTPLVFFCHQNPIAWPELAAGRPPHPYANATDDELLNADLARALIEAVFCARDEPSGRTRLLSRSDELRDRFLSREPPFFRADGNRLVGSGEYVVFLRPHIEGGRVWPTATIEVWSRRAANGAGPLWRRVHDKPLVVKYDEPFREGGPAHAGN